VPLECFANPTSEYFGSPLPGLTSAVSSRWDGRQPIFVKIFMSLGCLHYDFFFLPSLRSLAARMDPPFLSPAVFIPFLFLPGSALDPVAPIYADHALHFKLDRSKTVGTFCQCSHLIFCPFCRLQLGLRFPFLLFVPLLFFEYSPKQFYFVWMSHGHLS